MIKFIYSILFAIILFFAVRSSLIPYIASNENIVAILVIFILIIINSWILGLISNVRNKKRSN
ncbi:hypothetical protein COE80_22570 [Bacillus pseudomycoides]|uniref:hypothetical protein n=1 Tax=Bacillus pseudomycoides TaxID=64104 RepID=UPI000BFC0AA1|nr:hypothetical protein [Bacillus pseudomycoides]PHB21075.1 hypothetical protein COE80_22570 [Bacillus pseudomycoides]